MRLAPKSAEERIAARRAWAGIPENAVKDERSGPAGEGWSYEREGVRYACVFRGSSFKAEWHYRFKDEAARAERLRMFFESVASWNARKAKEKAERVAAPRGLEVGDVLHCTWGYDQTNNDYFEVTKLVGDKMVEIRKISAMYEETGWLRGRSVPVPGSYVGEPMVKLAKNGSVRIYSFASASKMVPTVVGGAKVFGSSYESSYA